MSEQTAVPGKVTKPAKDSGKPGAAKPVSRAAAAEAAAAAAREAKGRRRPAEPAPIPRQETETDAAPASLDMQASAATAPFLEAGVMTAGQRAQMEKLSMNLARAALTAQGAIAEMALRQADRPAALSPDPFHVAPALTEVMGRLAAEPDRLVRAQADLFSQYLDLWRVTAQRLSGEAVEPVVKPARGDRRFADPEWADHPVFDVIKQSYLLTSNWMNSLVADVSGVDPLAKRRVEFFMKMLTDAFSPSNFLASNPAALREVLATGGESLVRGMENFAADLERGGGQLSIAQTSFETFKIGENVATAPGKVVFRNELLELLQFSPTTETVFETPLVIFPPWINKFYIMDLRPENSMIRWLVGQGLTVFVVSWVNPDGSLANKDFEDYMVEGVYAATQAAMTQCGVDRVNAVGYCVGGTMLGATLAHMTATGDQRIASATFFAAQQDFSEAGDLLLFANEDWVAELEKKIDQGGGVLPGQTMADTFNALRANDLIWSFFVSNYLMGKEPKPFDLLFWNSDQTRMPKALHLDYLRSFYGRNAMAKGKFTVGGVRIDLKTVKTPIYMQSSKDDHIAPARSVYKGARLFGGPVTFTMAGSGHIAGVINPPAAQKYQHWTNDQLPETLAEWQAGAVEHPGSWWPHWMEWLKPKSGKQVPARDPVKGKFKVLGDAPGEYVRVRS